MRFDLTDLRLFVQVVETSSITGGARQANMALASASERIRDMEGTLGVALLERLSRGVRPTPAGRALVHHARIVLQQLERMSGELGEYAKGLKGHVRVLSNTAGLVEFLPEALATFMAANHAIDIDLEERSSHEIVPAIAAGLADIGIAADLVDIANVESFPFATDRLVVIVPKDHPLGQRRLANVDITYIPYSGGPPVVNALLGAHVTTVLANYADVVEHLNAGKLRALAIASHARIASLPEVPTVGESGYQGYDAQAWVGVLAPAKTPKDATSQLASWFTAAMKTPEVESKLAMLGLYPFEQCGADFSAHIKKQFEEYGRVIRDANIKAE